MADGQRFGGQRFGGQRFGGQQFGGQQHGGLASRQALANQLQAQGGEDVGGGDAEIEQAVAQKTGGLTLSSIIQWIMSAPPESVASTFAPVAQEVSRQAQGAPGETASPGAVAKDELMPPDMPLPLRAPAAPAAQRATPAVAAAQPAPSDFERILQAVSEGGA